MKGYCDICHEPLNKHHSTPCLTPEEIYRRAAAERAARECSATRCETDQDEHDYRNREAED